MAHPEVTDADDARICSWLQMISPNVILAEFQNMGMGTWRMRLMVWFNMRLGIQVLNGMSGMTGARTTMINQLWQMISVINGPDPSNIVPGCLLVPLDSWLLLSP
jgi:hypothetical protein